MQYLLTQKEYSDLQAEHSNKVIKWRDRAHAALGMLQSAKEYPCTKFGYCGSCELEKTDICFLDKTYCK